MRVKPRRPLKATVIDAVEALPNVEGEEDTEEADTLTDDEEGCTGRLNSQKQVCVAFGW